MLAKEYDPETSHKKPGFFPRLMQPKLDGVRMLASRAASGRVTLMSRAGKPFSHLVPSFEQDMASVPPGVVLDGELYLKGAGFQNIVSMVKTQGDGLGLERERLMFNVYDVYGASLGAASFEERERFLAALFKEHRFKRLVRVRSETVHNAAQVERGMDAALRDGYEGVMLRDPSAAYEPGKRSAALLKYKRFHDAEFEIVDYAEASGKDAGTVVFVCKAGNGRRFRVRPMGTREARTRMLQAAPALKGRMLTVKFQELTDDGVPRFPVGVAVRDYE